MLDCHEQRRLRNGSPSFVTEGRFLRPCGSKRAEPERFCYVYLHHLLLIFLCQILFFLPFPVIKAIFVKDADHLSVRRRAWFAEGILHYGCGNTARQKREYCNLYEKQERNDQNSARISKICEASFAETGGVFRSEGNSDGRFLQPLIVEIARINSSNYSLVREFLRPNQGAKNGMDEEDCCVLHVAISTILPHPQNTYWIVFKTL